jgi:cyclase
MLNPRIVPVLLLRGSGLVKTRRFGKARYLGDAINAVNIFAEKLVDEIVVIDIDATVEGRAPNAGLLRDIASEAFMPLAYGGGVRSLAQMEQLLRAGAEKIAVNAAWHDTPDLVTQAADRFGSQSVVVSIDYRQDRAGRAEVVTHRGRRRTGLTPLDCARRAQDAGAGEILLQSVDRDGERCGYDVATIRQVASAVRVPVMALGGADTVDDMAQAIVDGGAAAAAAGSLFVFYGRLQAVLITAPSEAERRAALALAADQRAAA